MKIKAFGEKYGVDTRTIDYWTNVGFLHPEFNPKNNYRDYGEKAEEEIKIILIAKAMNRQPMEETIELIRNTPKSWWGTFVTQKIREEAEKSKEAYRKALEYAEQLMRD